MTTVDEPALSGWRAQIAARALPDEAPCPVHPDRPAFQCGACAQERHERMLQERYEEMAALAAERLDKGVPRRYAHANQPRPDVAAWVAKYLAAPEDTPSLLLVGPTGTGKTWQAYAALRAVAAVPLAHPTLGYRLCGWEAATYADILASLRPNPRNDTEETLERYRQVPLLLIDDLGIAKGTEWVEESTYRLINGRYEDMRPSIFTSNLTAEQLKDSLGERIASRLQETCTRIVLTGADRRAARRTTEE